MGIIKAIIDDFKEDFKFLKKVGDGEYKFPYTLKEVLDIRPMLKDKKTWIMFMIVLAAVLTGMFVSAKYYQYKANEVMIKAADYINIYCLGEERNFDMPKFTLETFNNTAKIGG